MSGRTFWRVSRRGTTFQGFWHGPPLGDLRQACLKSFLLHGHSFHLYAYSEVDDAPPGVELKDANEIIPRDELFFFDNPMSGRPDDVGPFSDLFRFKLLCLKGGWWCDIDTACLTARVPAVRRAWARENPECAPKAVGVSQLALEKDDPLARELYDRCLALSRSPLTHREVVGPNLMSNVVEELNLPTDVVGLADTFYPLRWIETYKLWLPQNREEVERRVKDATFLHLFQSFPQYIGLDLQRLPPRGSYLSDFCERYMGSYHDGDRHSAQEVFDAARDFFQARSWAMDELRGVSGPGSLRELGLEEGDGQSA